MSTDKKDLYVDEEWYLQRYPDVRQGILSGRQTSAIQHYSQYGKSEGRRPFPFNEDWYLRTNPDVADALTRGAYASAEEHYAKTGRFERRRPIPSITPSPGQTLAFGAYGTNNVGDEAILDGLRAQYPNAVQIYHHRARDKNAVHILDAIAWNEFFRGSRLIIGGGGLLYSRHAVEDMITLALSARAAGAQVEILGLGCEAAEDSYFTEIRELTALAQRITVRTTTSAEILESIIGFRPEVQEDFAFNLRSTLRVRPVKRSVSEDIPLIGVVTGGDVRADFSALATLISSRLRSRLDRRARFIHIPHSRALVDRYNNDVVVGNALWSELGLDQLEDETAFRLAPFSPDPAMVLQTYAELDGVISSRFHGLVFANMANLPTLSMEGQTKKNQSFIRDYDNPNLFVSMNPGDLQETFGQFFMCVQKEWKKRIKV